VKNKEGIYCRTPGSTFSEMVEAMATDTEEDLFETEEMEKAF